MRSLVLSATAFALATCAFSAPASAASLKTTYVRTNGSDLCDGGADVPFSLSLHCAKKTITAGINAVAARGTVHVASGVYVENVTITKSVLVWGAGAGYTTVVPAVSAPNPCSDSSLCNGQASNVFLIRSSTVSLRGLTVDGDNPAKTGVNVGGANIDARNGIIEDHLSGVYSQTTVQDVEVKNVFLRGINAGSGGNDFAFHNNTVTNVQGSPASVGIFAYAARGTMSNNHVTLANDAISVNHSRGVKITGNLVEQSGSGIHIDNSTAPPPGYAQDLIQSNTVQNCTPGGFGIWIFVPHANALVDSNTVSLCDVGLAAVGGGVGLDVEFTSNTVMGDSSTGTAGIFVTTDTTGFGQFDTEALFTGDTVQGFEVAALVQQGAGKSATAYFDHERLQQSTRGIENDGTVQVVDSCLLSNDTGLLNHTGGSATVHTSKIAGNAEAGVNNDDAVVLDATDNWWGSPDGPKPTGPGDSVVGPVSYQPFLFSEPVACN